jgi:hypothetical protein
MAMYITLTNDSGTTHINSELIGGIQFSKLRSAIGNIESVSIFGNNGGTLGSTTNPNEIAALKWWMQMKDLHLVMKHEQHLALEQRDAEAARKLAEQEAEYNFVMEKEAEAIAAVFRDTDDQYGEAYRGRYNTPSEVFQKYAQYHVWERANEREPLPFPDWEDQYYIPF